MTAEQEAEARESDYREKIKVFADAVQAWDVPHTPTFPGLPEKWQEWTINPDGSISITLPAGFAYNLADEMREWEEVKGWVDREDCKNWKSSPIARENRRESIVYGNCLMAMRTILGRQQTKALIERVKVLNEIYRAKKLER